MRVVNRDICKLATVQSNALCTATPPDTDLLEGVVATMLVAISTLLVRMDTEGRNAAVAGIPELSRMITQDVLEMLAAIPFPTPGEKIH